MTKKKILDAKRDDKKGLLVTSAAMMNAAAAEPFANDILNDVSLISIADGLKQNIKAVQSGDMASIEAMLIGQAQALQTIFVSLGRKAASQTHLNQYTAFMNLALKAQSQSRATIQALTELKYPKQVAFVKQANISHGHQQVNNATNTNANAQEIKNAPNKLLEAENGEWLDTGTQGTTSRVNKTMATVEK